MDLFLILLGMSGGAFVGLLVAQAVPQAGGAVYSMFSILGMLAGTIGGYFFAWIVKDLNHSRNTAPPRRLTPPIAGNRCHPCGGRIILITDGHVCPHCNQVFCKNCQPRVPCSQCHGKVSADVPDNHDGPE